LALIIGAVVAAVAVCGAIYSVLIYTQYCRTVSGDSALDYSSYYYNLDLKNRISRGSAALRQWIATDAGGEVLVTGPFVRFLEVTPPASTASVPTNDRIKIFKMTAPLEEMTIEEHC
jgi:hypothetical protein